MASNGLPEAMVNRIVAMLGAGKGVTETARELGVSRDAVYKYKHKSGTKSPAKSATPPPDEFEEKADGTAAQFKSTFQPLKTMADVIRVCEIDTSVWEIVDSKISTWTVVLNIRGEKEPKETQQYGVRVHLKRILKRDLAEAMNLVFKRLEAAAPRWPKLKPPKGKGEEFMAVFALFDVHFGKLAWANETCENYDLKIAEAMFRNAVHDLMAESANRRVTKILLPIGNDWFHVDNRSHTTTRGTSQDVDGRFSKVLAVGTLAAIWAVELLATIAPVQVELVPGNHDRTLGECLAHILAARFHHTNRVKVNYSPITRKYVRFGTNLIGLTHGDLVKPDKLPGLMPVDAKKDWSETTTHEWLTGHGHRSQKWTQLDTDTQQGTVVRQLRALTRTDLWHYDHGYCGQHPAAEVYFYGHDRGYAGHAVVPART